MLNVCSLTARATPLPHCCACSVDGLSFINGIGMMTAQERKDFRRVQESRETWKKRAVRRGEDKRRFRERRHEVDRSRQRWRDRALAAEHRVEQLAVENHQLQSALTRAPAPSTIDNTHFFSAIYTSLWCSTVPSRSAPRAKCSVHFSSLARAWSPGCRTSRRALSGPCVSVSIACNRLSAPSRSREFVSPILRCRSGVRRPSSCYGSPSLPYAWAER